MDELMEMFDSFIAEAIQRENAMEGEFTEFEKKLTDCVAQANERGTPVQHKKRIRTQKSLSEEDESICSTKDDAEGRHKQQTDKKDAVVAIRSSARMLDVSGNSKTTAAASRQQSMETVLEKEASVRPSRTARLKAQEKLKEPMLNSKMRNESNAVIVKKERISTVREGGKDAGVGIGKKDHRIMSHEQAYVGMETENDPNFANKFPSSQSDQPMDDGFGSTNESSGKSVESAMVDTAAHRDTSIMVVPLPIPKVEVLSDEEMPPPKMVPPKMTAPKVRTKKKALVKEEAASSSAVSSADSSMESTISSMNSTAARPKRGRPPKTNPAIVPPVPETEASVEVVRVKTEKLSMIQSEQQQHQQQEQEKAKTIRSSDKSVYEDAREQQEQRQGQSRVEQQTCPVQVVLVKMDMPKVTRPSNKNNTVAQVSPANGTFRITPSTQKEDFTVDLPPKSSPCDETFNISPKQTLAQSLLETNDTFVIAQTDTTTNKENPVTVQQNIANASIMTEDDSVVENSPNQAPTPATAKPTPIVSAAAPPAPPAKSKKFSATATALKKSTSTSAKATSACISSPRQPQVKAANNHKELFNSCVMSPIKSRIEAFEKCATTGTLTKGTTTIGTPQAKIGRILKTISTPSLATTPQFSSLESLGSVRSAHAKESVFTPNFSTQLMPKASSASKIHMMQSKALQHKTAVTGCSTRTVSRDSSMDRAVGTGTGSSGTLSAASSLSSLLEDKKKQRAEKHRLATLQREAKERERREQAERLVREKEEKHRKLVQEKHEKIRIDAEKKASKMEQFEKRRQMEEQRALADQKRDELAKQLEQQRIDRQLLETLKQNQMKENQDTKLHKQLYQQKLRHQQQLQQQQHLQQQQMCAKKKTAAANKQVFNFEMIDTDDTTDEDEAEDVAARKKKRPPPPQWCRDTAEFRKILTVQAQVDTKVIDRLFSVQPMTPDLRQLFPSIDANKLKRNSSAIWRTPPRYSQIP